MLVDAENKRVYVYCWLFHLSIKNVWSHVDL